MERPKQMFLWEGDIFRVEDGTKNLTQDIERPCVPSRPKSPHVTITNTDMKHGKEKFIATYQSIYQLD